MEIKRYCSFDKLMTIALQIIDLYKDLQTVNPHKNYYELPKELAHPSAIELQQLLIHAITCLHHRQRETTQEGKYISEEEDNTTALSLLQQILPLPEYTLNQSEIIFYKTLYDQYQENETFTTKEVVRKRWFKSEYTRKMLYKLHKMGLIKSTGNKYRGYRYQLNQ